MLIRPWIEEDRPCLLVGIEDFFRSGLEQGSDVLATRRNAEIYFNLGLKAAGRGDPCLVGLKDGVFAGFVMWLGLESLLEQRWNTIHALGSYTFPGFRSTGVADMLRIRAREIAKEKGYNRIFGPVYGVNKRGIEVFKHYYKAEINSLNFEQFI